MIIDVINENVVQILVCVTCGVICFSLWLK